MSNTMQDKTENIMLIGFHVKDKLFGFWLHMYSIAMWLDFKGRDNMLYGYTRNDFVQLHWPISYTVYYVKSHFMLLITPLIDQQMQPNGYQSDLKTR